MEALVRTRGKLLRNRHHNDIRPLRGWIGMTETQPDMTRANRKRSGSGTQSVDCVGRFLVAKMKTKTRRQIASMVLAATGVWFIGCRHMAVEEAQGMSTQFAGDPSTNVIIVPAWAAPDATAGSRPATNQLAARPPEPNAFPFPDYDQQIAKSVYDRWLVLLKNLPGLPHAGQVEVEFSLTPEGYVFGWRTTSEELPICSAVLTAS